VAIGQISFGSAAWQRATRGKAAVVMELMRHPSSGSQAMALLRHRLSPDNSKPAVIV